MTAIVQYKSHALNNHHTITTMRSRSLNTQTSPQLLDIDIASDAVLLPGQNTTLSGRIAVKGIAASHTSINAIPNSIGNSLPHSRLINHHLGRVKDPAVRSLVPELQRRLGQVALPDAVSGVDDRRGWGAVEWQLGVVAQRGRVPGFLLRGVAELEDLLDGLDYVVVGVVVCAFDTADSLDDVGVGAAA